jgi:hypothetical protein
MGEGRPRAESPQALDVKILRLGRKPGQRRSVAARGPFNELDAAVCRELLGRAVVSHSLALAATDIETRLSGPLPLKERVMQHVPGFHPPPQPSPQVGGSRKTSNGTAFHGLEDEIAIQAAMQRKRAISRSKRRWAAPRSTSFPNAEGSRKSQWTQLNADSSVPLASK